ncbi:MAG TPA: bifunctional alpha,alpha-trehalose-phosphate synthase (UDP-forming)/trehalose-phosphatase [Vicinamibacterales bacterium]|nr:bifunctional alpha,alpha-trehalose-phosphate synthase (UDP-forming)/trehalose-phosphatase [Vicinamibacterales bacterium]
MLHVQPPHPISGLATSAVAELPTTGRVLIVSNRLPVTVQESAGGVEVVPSAGGLASGLRGYYQSAAATWIGWPGPMSPAASRGGRRSLEAQLSAHNLKLVDLDQRDVEEYYDGFSNGVIWPLFHYLLDRLPLRTQNWDAYRRVNQRFADAIVDELRPGELVWVHDYHLMLVPGLVRERRPDARIGFFLHIPFPSAEVFRILPWRRELLMGVLGADLVGFHTPSYAGHFAAAVHAQCGLDASHDRVRVEGRTVRLGHFPMGPDVEQFERLARDQAVREETARLREESRGRFLFLGVDRLDYTKGIPRRLVAFERLLQRDPSLRDKVRLVQLAVPSRSGVREYASFRKQVEELVGRINGSLGTLDSVPIHYLHQTVTPEQLTALYCAADAMLVTPLRDGMNLVAKEYIAARADEDGVLLLSEFAGAAEELGEAVIINPYDENGMADSMAHAMAMGRPERTARMRALRRRVLSRPVNDWAQRFLEAVTEAAESRGGPEQLTDPNEIEGLMRRVTSAARVVLVLDYDGTLVGLREMPELATPDAGLLGLLTVLSTTCDVHLASGRPREVIDGWFGNLPVGLWAEHGLWYRPAPGEPWQKRADVPTDWMPGIRKRMEGFVALAPGARIEEKSASLAWHYRMVEPGTGEAQAAALRRELERLVAGRPFEVIEGHKVIEVRQAAVDKGSVVREVVARAPEGALIVAIGDDRTDEDMFAALPPGGVAIRVGGGDSAAPYRLDSPTAVRALLGALT